MGSGAKSYMRQSFPKYEEMHKYFHHIRGGRQSYMTLHPILRNILIYEENFLFFSISARTDKQAHKSRRNFLGRIGRKGKRLLLVYALSILLLSDCPSENQLNDRNQPNFTKIFLACEFTRFCKYFLYRSERAIQPLSPRIEKIFMNVCAPVLNRFPSLV